MPQSNWNKLHNTQLMREKYKRIFVLIQKGGEIDTRLPEIRESIRKDTGESLSQYVAESFRRRLIADGYLEPDK